MMDNMKTLAGPYTDTSRISERICEACALSNIYTVTTGLYLIGLINLYWYGKAFVSH
jgi:hypothetical protein